jgi:Ca2+/H+ antiporter
MYTHKPKGKAPFLLYSLFLVIVVLATFNYFLSSDLQPHQKFIAHSENNNNLKIQEKVVFSEEEESKLTRSCLLLWGASHQGDRFIPFLKIMNYEGKLFH